MEKQSLLISTENAAQSDMVMDVLRQENIPALAQARNFGAFLEAYMGYSVYGDDIYVDEADLARAQEAIDGMFGDEA